MTEFRENLLDRMIRIYGFENPIVIDFAKLCDNPLFQDNLLEQIVKAHEEFPAIDEGE